MNKNEYYQVGKSKKVSGKGKKITGFLLNSNSSVILKKIKPIINTKTKEGKMRLFCILIVFLLITSGGFGYKF